MRFSSFNYLRLVQFASGGTTATAPGTLECPPFRADLKFERLVHTQEVAGSSPAAPTIFT